MTKYRVAHPPGDSYTEFVSLEAAQAFRDEHYPNAQIQTIEMDAE